MEVKSFLCTLYVCMHNMYVCIICMCIYCIVCLYAYVEQDSDVVSTSCSELACPALRTRNSLWGT